MLVLNPANLNMTLAKVKHFNKTNKRVGNRHRTKDDLYTRLMRVQCTAVW